MNKSNLSKWIQEMYKLFKVNGFRKLIKNKKSKWVQEMNKNFLKKMGSGN